MVHFQNPPDLILPPTLATIIECSALLDLPPEEITGPVRTKRLVYARFAIIWAVRRAHRKTFSEIGRAMGGRDHSTIRNAFLRAILWRRTDPWFHYLSSSLLTRAQERAEKQKAGGAA